MLGVMALVAMAVIFGDASELQSAYHKWRLGSAIKKARTAGAGKPTAGQELLALLRGKSASTEDYMEAWARHENALVKLKVLDRREFALGRRVVTEDRFQISQAAEREFGRNGLWSVGNGADNHTIVITAPSNDFPRWEQLMHALREQGQTARRFGFLRPERTLAW